MTAVYVTTVVVVTLSVSAVRDIVLVFVMCGYRPVRTRQQCVNQRDSLKLLSTGRISQDWFSIWQ